MKCSRGVPVVLATLIAVVLGSAGWLVSSAHGQTVDRLRPEVTTAENLTNDHRQQIARYIEGWTEVLMSGDDQQVTEARQRLLEPLRAGTPSDAFVRHYSPEVGDQVAAALEHDQPITRVNAMIIVARLDSSDAMPLIEQAMTDENAAVRYWAVKAVQSISFSNEQMRQLIDRLVAHVEREPEVQVIEQTLLALVRLDLSEARLRGLALLNDRVDEHLAEPGMPLQAEHSTLRGVYQYLAATSDPNEDELRELARTAVRYQDLASQQLAADAVGSHARDSYERTLQLCNAALRFAADSLEVNNVPTSIDSLVNRGDWAGIQRNVEAWRALLQRAPFNFSAEDLGVES